VASDAFFIEQRRIKMKNLNVKILSLFCFILIANFVEAQEIKIGTIFPRSGAIAMLGEQAYRGADLARQMVNEKGGVKGAKVVFISADAPDPQAAVTEAERLISKEKVPVIIGSLTSGNALAIAPVAERNGVILWETSGISDDITKKGYKYVFRTCDRGGIRGQAGVTLSVDTLAPLLNLKDVRLAMVYEDSSYGTSQYDGALDEMKKRNLKFVMAAPYSKTATDLSSLILKLKEAKPDIIFTVGYINDAQLFCNQLREHKAVPKALVGGGAGYTDPQFEVGQGKFANGVFGLDMPSNLPLEVMNSDTTRPLAKEFRDRYKKAYNEDVSLAAEVVFVGTYALLNDVLPNSSTLKADDIRKAALSTHVKDTIIGWEVKFDEKTGQNIGANPIAYQWQDGKKFMVWPEKVAVSKIGYLPLKW
jgi:branched-chain amino acid transport system substrate-binding protein